MVLQPAYPTAYPINPTAMASRAEEVLPNRAEQLVLNVLPSPAAPAAQVSSTKDEQDISQEEAVLHLAEVIPRAHRFECPANHAQIAAALREAARTGTVQLLPGYPEPGSRERLLGSIGSTGQIVCIVASLVGLTHGVALVVGDLPPLAWWICLVMVYTEGSCALLLLAMILCGGAGEIERSPETCFPVPHQVLSALEAGQNPSNIEDPLNERSYCVRCYVWRNDRGPAGLRPHHCRVCQRCVADFDHHW